jgi:ABC-type nitrate/sulfonate/bicarbonate transport system substrate-binding protein
MSSRRNLLRLAAAIGAACAVLGLVACGSDEGSDSGGGADQGGGAQRATLVLDFVPGPVHAGIYRALEQGYYEREGIDLQIIQPTSTADTLKLIDAGKAQFGIADGVDVAIQIAEGRDAKAIMALTQRPLGGLITLEEAGIDSPAELEGKTVGVTGVPSDDAILEAVLESAGADPSSVERVTIGFNGVQSLENGKIEAFTGYIPADGVQIEVDGFPVKAFPLDENGGPRYPGLVVFSTEEAIAENPELMRSFVRATIRGYEDVLADPQVGLEALLAQNKAIPREFAEASLEAYEPLFQADAERYGAFNADDLEALSRFMVDSGLAKEPIAADRYATNEFVEGEG